MSSNVTERVRVAVLAEIEKRDLTQRQVGQIIGKSQAAAWRRLSGETPFAFADLEALAQAMNVPVTLFVPEGAS